MDHSLKYIEDIFWAILLIIWGICIIFDAPLLKSALTGIVDKKLKVHYSMRTAHAFVMSQK